jgi:glycosyltransferase involved in cell wall biosynthesis
MRGTLDGVEKELPIGDNILSETNNETLPRVSVVVCTYNDEDYIGECVDALLAQTYPRNLLELIVVDDGSTDRTPDILRRYERVRYLWQRNQGPSAARNLGIVNATGEYVCFTDSDCRVAPGWVEHLIAAQRRGEAPDCCGAGGRQAGHPDDPPFARQVDRFLSAVGFIGDYVKPHMAAQKVGHNASCNTSYLRQALLEVGGFRIGMFPGEDVDLDRRLADQGWTVWFTPDAVVFHHRPAGWVGLIRMLRSYGRASADNVTIHGFFREIHFVPFAVVTLLATMGWALIFQKTVPVLTGCVFFGLGLCFLIFRSGLRLFRVTAFAMATICFFSLEFFVRFVTNWIRPPYDLERRIDPLLSNRGTVNDA